MSEIYIEHINKENVSLIQDFCTVKNEKDNDYFKSYLMYNGLLDSEQGMAKTKLYIEEDDNGHKKILGFYSIRCSSLIMDSGEGSEKMGEPAVAETIFMEFFIAVQVVTPKKIVVMSCLHNSHSRL